MRRLFALLVALLLLGSSLSVVVAQDDALADPRRGNEVPFLDEDGNELAVLVVEDLIDPFEDSADDPPRRSHFVLVTLSIENTGEDLLEVDPATILLQDDEGFLYAAEEDLDLGDEDPLEAADLDAGDDVTGAIAYAVPNSAAAPARLFYAPDDDRLILLTDVRSGGAGPEPTEEATEEATEEPDETPVVVEGCEGVEEWIEETFARFDQVGVIFDDVLPEDVDLGDPDALDNIRAGADDLDALADEQESGDVPEAAAEANDLMVQMLRTYAQALNEAVDLIEANEDIQPAIDLLTEGDELSGQMLDAIDDLEAECA